jgi:hypothetical protein
MKKLLTIISLASMILLSNANAEMRLGVSGALTQIDADGKETEGGEVTSSSVDNLVIVPSIFAEYQTGQLNIGLDYIPLKADVSNKTKNRTDVETSVMGSGGTTSTQRKQSANASLENHLTLYANYNLTDTFFVKGGMAYVTLKTEDSLETGSKYGDEDIYGAVVGAGFTDGNSRLELVYTDYEDIVLTSSVARTGVVANKIEADLDTLSLKYSYLF